MRSALWYSRKYFIRRRKLTLTIFIIITIIAVFISFESAFYYQIEYRNTRTTQLFKRLIKIWLTNPVPSSNLSVIENIEGVDIVFPFMMLQYEVRNLANDKSLSYPVEFVNLSVSEFLLENLGYSEKIQGDLVLGFLIAIKLDVKPRDIIKIGGVNLSVSKILPQTYSDLDLLILADIDIFNNYFASPELIDKYNGAYILIKQGADENLIADKLRNKLSIRYILTPSEYANELERVSKIQLISSLFFSLIAIIIGFSVITIYLYRDFEARKRELAILVALGAKRKQILFSFTLPMYILASLGIFMGCVVGFYVVIPYYHIFVYGYTRSFVLETYIKALITTTLLLSVTILLVTFMLHRKIKKIKAMEMLRAEI